MTVIGKIKFFVRTTCLSIIAIGVAASTPALYSQTAIIATPFDLNGNGILDKDEAEVVVTSTISLPAGEYFFNNLTLTNRAILIAQGDADASSSFKGVKITATNLIINLGSGISADGQGYVAGPGASPSVGIGASHGGVGGNNAPGTRYGSAVMPLDLGSGVASHYRGGGAIHLVVNGNLQNDGAISADGVNYGSSGGSIYIITGAISGGGSIHANGGNNSWPYVHTGSGGRVAVHYKTFSYTGSSGARAGMHCFYGCAPAGESGTVGFFDISRNDLTVTSFWRFQKNDELKNFNHIILKNSATAVAEEGVQVRANDLLVNGGSQFNFSNDQIVNISSITVDGASVMTLSGTEKLTTDTLTVVGRSTVTVLPERVLSLTLKNLMIGSGSSISVERKGYRSGQGHGVSTSFYGGASYGGIGYRNIASSSYGSAVAPVDLGSGGNGHPSYAQGGGAIKIVTDNTITVDGVISADGGVTASGGSIYITVGSLAGSGTIHANGGGFYWQGQYIGMGGGGRVAVYYATSTFSGGTFAKGGCNSFDSWTMTCAGNGTVIAQTVEKGCQKDCYSSVLFLPGLMGSRLYEQDGLSDKELWVSADDALHARLSLDRNGKSINPVYTKDDTRNNGELDETGVVDDAYGANIYQSLVADLRKWKSEGVYADYAFIPYDWRLSLNDIITNGATTTQNNLAYTGSQDFSESYILKKLAELQKTSHSGKVTIVAHSNGGLVAEALMQKLKDTRNPLYDQIDKLILVAVPQVGTPEAIAGLLHGTELGSGLIMNAERSRQLSENMPAMYNMLPSAGYFTTVGPGFVVDKPISFEDIAMFGSQISQYGLFVSNETELKNYVLGSDGRSKPSFSDTVNPNIGNSVLYTSAQAVHQTLDSWQPASTTKVIQVAGWGEETLAGVDYKKKDNTDRR